MLLAPGLDRLSPVQLSLEHRGGADLPHSKNPTVTYSWLCVCLVSLFTSVGSTDHGSYSTVVFTAGKNLRKWTHTIQICVVQGQL